MFKETEAVDDSTCALYDIYLYVLNELCSLKDNITSIIPIRPENDIYSIDDDSDKTGLLILSSFSIQLQQ